MTSRNNKCLVDLHYTYVAEKDIVTYVAIAAPRRYSLYGRILVEPFGEEQSVIAGASLASFQRDLW